MCPPQFARNQPAHPRQFFRRCGINRKKLLRQPHRAKRNADRVLDALVFRKRDLATAAAEIDQQHFAAGARLAAHDAVMNQPAFFEARD